MRHILHRHSNLFQLLIKNKQAFANQPRQRAPVQPAKEALDADDALFPKEQSSEDEILNTDIQRHSKSLGKSQQILNQDLLYEQFEKDYLENQNLPFRIQGQWQLAAPHLFVQDYDLLNSPKGEEIAKKQLAKYSQSLNLTLEKDLFPKLYHEPTFYRRKAKYHLSEIQPLTSSFINQGHNFVDKKLLMHLLEKQNVKVLKQLLTLGAFQEADYIDDEVLTDVLVQYELDKRSLFMVNLLPLEAELLQGTKPPVMLHSVGEQIKFEIQQPIFTMILYDSHSSPEVNKLRLLWSYQRYYLYKFSFSQFVIPELKKMQFKVSDPKLQAVLNKQVNYVLTNAFPEEALVNLYISLIQTTKTYHNFVKSWALAVILFSKLRSIVRIVNQSCNNELNPIFQLIEFNMPKQISDELIQNIYPGILMHEDSNQIWLDNYQRCLEHWTEDFTQPQSTKYNTELTKLLENQQPSITVVFQHQEKVEPYARTTINLNKTREPKQIKAPKSQKQMIFDLLRGNYQAVFEHFMMRYSLASDFDMAAKFYKQLKKVDKDLKFKTKEQEALYKLKVASNFFFTEGICKPLNKQSFRTYKQNIEVASLIDRGLLDGDQIFDQKQVEKVDEEEQKVLNKMFDQDEQNIDEHDNQSDLIDDFTNKMSKKGEILEEESSEQNLLTLKTNQAKVDFLGVQIPQHFRDMVSEMIDDLEAHNIIDRKSLTELQKQPLHKSREKLAEIIAKYEEFINKKIAQENQAYQGPTILEEIQQRVGEIVEVNTYVGKICEQFLFAKGQEEQEDHQENEALGGNNHYLIEENLSEDRRLTAQYQSLDKNPITKSSIDGEIIEQQMLEQEYSELDSNDEINKQIKSLVALYDLTTTPHEVEQQLLEQMQEQEILQSVEDGEDVQKLFQDRPLFGSKQQAKPVKKEQKKENKWSELNQWIEQNEILDQFKQALQMQQEQELSQEQDKELEQVLLQIEQNNQQDQQSMDSQQLEKYIIKLQADLDKQAEQDLESEELLNELQNINTEGAEFQELSERMMQPTMEDIKEEFEQESEQSSEIDGARFDRNLVHFYNSESYYLNSENTEKQYTNEKYPKGAPTDAESDIRTPEEKQLYNQLEEVMSVLQAMPGYDAFDSFIYSELTEVTKSLVAGKLDIEQNAQTEYLSQESSEDIDLKKIKKQENTRAPAGRRQNQQRRSQPPKRHNFSKNNKFTFCTTQPQQPTEAINQVAAQSLFDLEKIQHYREKEVSKNFLEMMKNETHIPAVGSGLAVAKYLFLHSKLKEKKVLPNPQKKLSIEFTSVVGTRTKSYQAFLKNTLYNYELQDNFYQELLEDQLTNYNRYEFKQIVAHMIYFKNSFTNRMVQLICEICDEHQTGYTFVEIAQFINANQIVISVEALEKITYTWHRFRLINEDMLSFIREYCKNVNVPFKTSFYSHFCASLIKIKDFEKLKDLCSAVLTEIKPKSFKVDNNTKAADVPALEKAWKIQQQAQYVRLYLELIEVVVSNLSTQIPDYLLELFTQYRKLVPSLGEKQLGYGLVCSCLNKSNFLQLLKELEKNPKFGTEFMYDCLMQSLLSNFDQLQEYSERMLDCSVFINRLVLNTQRIQRALLVFKKSSTSNSFSKFLEHCLRFQPEVTTNADIKKEMFYILNNNVEDVSVGGVFNLLDFIFNEKRQEERIQYRQIKLSEEEKERKLAEIQEAKDVQNAPLKSKKKTEQQKQQLQEEDKNSTEGSEKEAQTNKQKLSKKQIKQVKKEKQKESAKGKEMVDQMISESEARSTEDMKETEKSGMSDDEIIGAVKNQGSKHVSAKRAGIKSFGLLYRSSIEMMQAEEEANKQAEKKAGKGSRKKK